MINAIVDALKNSLVPNKEIITNATNEIEKYSFEPNYLPTLMMITDNQELPIEIRLAALANFKQVMQKRWKKKTNQIS